MEGSEMEIRVMREEELSYLFEWAASQKWRSEPEHIACLFKTEREGFFIAYVDERPVGMVLAVSVGESFGVISNLFLLQEFRLRGLGRRVFEHALEYLKGRTLFLDSVIGIEEMYARDGFEAQYDVSCHVFQTGSITLPKSDIKVVKHVDIERVLAFDTEASGLDRRDYMHCLLRSEKMVFRAVDDGDKLSSYGLRFEYADGHKIILASRDINEAVTLFFELIVNIRLHTPIYLSATDNEPMVLAIITLLKMQRVSKNVRMIRQV